MQLDHNCSVQTQTGAHTNTNAQTYGMHMHAHVYTHMFFILSPENLVNKFKNKIPCRNQNESVCTCCNFSIFYILLNMIHLLKFTI